MNCIKTRAGLAIGMVLAGAGGAALAQSHVTVYGMLDVGLVRERVGPHDTVTKVSSGVSNGSRLGFKGVEALGGGWSALFLLESGFQLDTGAMGQGALFGRQIYAGLQGPGGTLTAGRQYTPQFDTLVLADPFASGTVADAKNLLAITGDGSTRMNNTVKYASPVQAGFSGELVYAPAELAGRQTGGALAYAAGALNFRLGYHYRSNDTLPVRSSGARNTLLAATYDFGPVKAHLGYGIDKGLNSTPLRNQANPYGYAIAPVASSDSTGVLLGLSAPLGRHTLLASYVRKDDRTVRNQDARQLAVGHRYALSKRTDTYAVVARIRNRNGASYTVGNASEGGTGNQAVSVGLRHKF